MTIKLSYRKYIKIINNKIKEIIAKDLVPTINDITSDVDNDMEFDTSNLINKNAHLRSPPPLSSV